MNTRLKRLWIRRSNRYIASAAWLVAMPFAIALLIMLYPFDAIHEWAEAAWEEDTTE